MQAAALVVIFAGHKRRRELGPQYEPSNAGRSLARERAGSANLGLSNLEGFDTEAVAKALRLERCMQKPKRGHQQRGAISAGYRFNIIAKLIQSRIRRLDVAMQMHYLSAITNDLLA